MMTSALVWSFGLDEIGHFFKFKVLFLALSLGLKYFLKVLSEKSDIEKILF